MIILIIRMEPFFTNIYENCCWGNDSNNCYNGNSGGGSEIEFNKDEYIPFLRNFIINHNIKTVIDLGCGDFKCGKLIYDDLDIKYTGYDTYKKIVEHHTIINPPIKYNFVHLDIFNNKEKIINGDLCILKDILQHWTCEEVYSFLDYLIKERKFQYIIISNCSNQKINNYPNYERSTPLSANYYPLKKYNPKILLNYKTKEVSLITLT